MRVPASCEIPTKSTTRAAAKRTRRAKGAWTARRDIPSDARRMRLLRVGRRGIYAHLTRGQRDVSREGGRDNRSILRVSGEQLEAACGEPAKQPRHPAQTGTVREPRAPPHPTRKRSKRSNGAPRNGKTSENAPRENIATASQAKSASGHNHATIGRLGAHRGEILPLPVARERISRAFCHRRAPGNASRHNLAVAGSPKMHCGNTLPRQPPSRMLLDDILPRRPSTARACCEIAVVPRSRKTPPERSVGQFNTTR